MFIEAKVCRIDGSLGIVLPKEALEALGADEGATVQLVSAPGNSLRISVVQSDFAEKMKIAERCMSKYENALRELAK